ncbi:MULTISPECIES: response regulator [Haloferacaceae]|uniref:Response regulator n=1 Tax=Halorubrum glutamatedens TaxID=2707018 RepID=A0ABD5QP00_9EURY|nr:response regulator [Halobellus captivus]
MTERPASVLLADPHDEFAAALETTLADATGEFELRHVRDLRTARDAFDPARHDCVLVERDLGSGIGLDLLAAVRRIDPGVPVFVVTADGDEAFAASAVDAGATGYVRKGDPDALADLRDRIRRARTVRAGGDDADHAATIERLRASAERLDTILEHTTNLVFMKDTDDRYLLVNDAFASLVGVPREEIIGATTAEVHGGEFAGRFRANDEAAIAAGEP